MADLHLQVNLGFVEPDLRGEELAEDPKQVEPHWEHNNGKGLVVSLFSVQPGTQNVGHTFSPAVGKCSQGGQAYRICNMGGERVYLAWNAGKLCHLFHPRAWIYLQPVPVYVLCHKPARPVV